MIDLLIFGFVILLIAFFSSAEIAYVALAQSGLGPLKKKKIPFIALTKQLLSKPEETIVTITIGSTISVFIFAFFLSKQFIDSPLDWFGLMYDILAVTCASLLVIFSAKILPKLFIRHFPDYTAIAISPIIRGLQLVLWPILAIIQKTLNGFGYGTTFLNHSQKGNLALDFETIQSESPKDYTKKNKEILSNIFSITDVCVKDSMVPRTEIHGVSIKTSIMEVHQEFITTGHSQLPVYDDTIDTVVGIINVYDLFKRPSSIKDILMDIQFIPERKKSVELLHDFVKQHHKSAIVVDEFGGTSGFVTSEDLIEELLGDIQDEYDTEDNICRALSDNIFLISGRISIDAINEKFDLNIPKEESYETIAGFILSKIGKIPKAGEVYQIDNYMIRILRSAKTKIEIVKVQVLN